MNITDLLKNGELLFSQGNSDEAKEVFLRVIEQEPGNKEALNNLGVVAFSRGDAEGALKYFRKAVDCDPLYLDALVNLCEVLQSRGSMAEALPYIERAIELNRENEKLGELLNDAVQSATPSRGDHAQPLEAGGTTGQFSGSPGLRPEKIRVIHLPLVIANTAIALSKYLNRIGVDSKVISYFRTWLNYEGDINLELDNLSAADRNKKIAAFVDDFLENEAHKYDIFHFHFFDSLSTGSSFGGWRSHPDREPYWDLEYIKNLGKKIVVSSWGSDITNNSKIVYYRLQYEQAGDGIPYPPLNRKDQYNTIWKFAQLADVIVHGDQSLVKHAPHGTMIPMGMDLEPFDQLEWGNPPDDKRVSIVHAPSNHFYKGTVHVEEMFRKVRERYGDAIEIRLITGVAYQEAIKQYCGRGLAIDQIGAITFGLFALETAYLGRTVITSLHRDEYFGDDPKLKIPVVAVQDRKDFCEKIFHYIDSMFLDRSTECKQLVRENFSASLIVNQYKMLYEKLMSGEKIEQYVSQEWYREFSTLVSGGKVDGRDYYPVATDRLLQGGDFEKLVHEIQMGLGLNNDMDLLAKYILVLELTDKAFQADLMRKNNRTAVSTKEFKQYYRRGKELSQKGRNQ